jgi:hypothetical protein
VKRARQSVQVEVHESPAQNCSHASDSCFKHDWGSGTSSDIDPLPTPRDTDPSSEHSPFSVNIGSQALKTYWNSNPSAVKELEVDTREQPSSERCIEPDRAWSGILFNNTLQLPYTISVTAIAHNATAMRLDITQISNPAYLSPFYRPSSPSSSPSALLASARAAFPSLPGELLPTLPQVLFPHPACLDLLPLPALRARAIVLSVMLPPSVFDVAALKTDIYVEGGMAFRDGEGRGGRRKPWDVGCWEAKPWFLRKWRLVIDGDFVEAGT